MDVLVFWSYGMPIGSGQEAMVDIQGTECRPVTVLLLTSESPSYKSALRTASPSCICA